MSRPWVLTCSHPLKSNEILFPSIDFLRPLDGNCKLTKGGVDLDKKSVSLHNILQGTVHVSQLFTAPFHPPLLPCHVFWLKSNVNVFKQTWLWFIIAVICVYALLQLVVILPLTEFSAYHRRGMSPVNLAIHMLTLHRRVMTERTGRSHVLVSPRSHPMIITTLKWMSQRNVSFFWDLLSWRKFQFFSKPLGAILCSKVMADFESDTGEMTNSESHLGWQWVMLTVQAVFVWRPWQMFSNYVYYPIQC